MPADVTSIRDFANRIAAEFHPNRIILFGSHARGQASGDSDVDLLVVIPHEGKPWRMATAIRGRVRPTFPVDLLVRTPESIRERLEMGDNFIREIVEEGEVLYEAPDA